MPSKKILALSLSINIFFLGLCLIFGNLRFGANDDCFMSGILSGMYGQDFNVHLTFVNALYGYALLPFYHIFPKINWYYIGEMSSIFISLTTVGYIIIKKVGCNWGMILTSLLVALCASDYYIVLQFTQCAAMLSAAGMLCCIYGFENRSARTENAKATLLTIAIGIALLLWGSCMRWPAYLMGLPFFAAALLFNVKKYWKIKKFVLSTLLIAFTCSYAAHQFDRSLYQAPDYKKYIDFQAPRSLLGDGSNYDQGAVYEDLEELGFSGQDYALLLKWTFYDKKVFSPEKINVVTNIISKHFFPCNVQSIPQKLLNALVPSTRNPIFFAWLLFSVALIIFNRKKSFWEWVTLIPMLLMFAYLLNLNRFVYRVETGLWLYATILTIPLLKERFFIPRKISIFALMIIALFNINLYATNGKQFRSPNSGELITSRNMIIDTSDYKGFLAYTDSMPDSIVFFMEMNSYSALSERRTPPYISMGKSSWEQIFSFGYWTPYFPDLENAMLKRGVTNPIEDVVKENVFVVNEPRLIDFLERHYYKKVDIDTVRNFNGMIVYKYSIAPDSIAEVSP